MATSIGDSFWNRVSAGKQRALAQAAQAEASNEASRKKIATESSSAKEVQDEFLTMRDLEDLLPSQTGYPSEGKISEEKEKENADFAGLRRMETKLADQPSSVNKGSRYGDRASARDGISIATAPPNVASPAALRPSFPPKSAHAIANRADGHSELPDGLSVVGVRSRGNAPPPRVDYLKARTETEREHTAPPSSSSSSRGESDSELELMLDTLLDATTPVVTDLSERLATLRALRVQWEQGDSIQLISRLLVIFDESLEDGGNENDLVALSDFLSAADLKCGGLNLDACTKLLPLFESMLNECMHLPHVVLAAVSSTAMLCSAFGDLIRQTRAAVVVGVDLSREERLRKCNSCHASLFRIRKRLEAVMRQYAPREGIDRKAHVQVQAILVAAKKLTALILDI